MVDTPLSRLPDAGAFIGGEVSLISQKSSTVFISAGTISAQASDNSFNDSANGFLAAGFAVGDYVNVSGFTGDTANNINSAKITALTAAKMTIGGTDGDVIVDDAAGETVVIRKWTSRKSNITGLGLSETIRDGNSNSTSTYASKGNILLATDNLKVYGFTAIMGAAGTYKAVLAFLDGSNVITSIAGSTVAGALVAGTKRFKFTTPIAVPSGQRFAIIVVNTTAPSTTAAQVSFIGGTVGNPGWGFDWIGSVRYASNNPTVGDNVFFNNTDSVTARIVYGI